MKVTTDFLTDSETGQPIKFSILSHEVSYIGDSLNIRYNKTVYAVDENTILNTIEMPLMVIEDQTLVSDFIGSKPTDENQVLGTDFTDWKNAMQNGAKNNITALNDFILAEILNKEGY